MASSKSINIYIIFEIFYGGQKLHKYFRSFFANYRYVSVDLLLYRRIA